MNGLSYSNSRRYSTKNNLTELVCVSYALENEIKSGVIKLYLTLDMEKDKLRYRGIDYSDPDLKSYVERNPSVLTKINSLRNAFGNELN